MFGFGSGNKKDTSPNPETFSHASDMLKAASPYLTSDLRKSLELFVKTFEFMNTLRNFASPHNKVEAFETQKEIDFEGLLQSIRPHCNKQEAEMVDLFLNMMSATNFYKTYKEMASMFAQTSGADSESSGEEGSPFGSSMGNQQMFDTLAEMLPPEQKSTLETMKMLMESGMLNQMFTQES